jgi:hypothetical protein
MSNRCLLLRVVCWSAGIAFFSALPAVAEDSPPDFARRIQPLVEKYCADCHSDDYAEGDLSLEGYASLKQVRRDREVWLKVLAQLQAEAMPPEDSDQPTGEERKQLILEIDKAINQVDCSQPQSPGHVTLRRLNRFEYRNTIRDLLGVDYEPARDFPADDVGYGFDNIGDVMSLPTLLMEKYLTAAEEITKQVIVVPDGTHQLRHRQAGAKLTGAGSASRDSARQFSTNGEATVEITFPAEGQYQFRITASADQAGDEPAKMSLRLNGQEVTTIDVTAERDEPETYRRRVAVKAGKQKIGLAFINDFWDPKQENPRRRDRNLSIERLEIHGPLDTDWEKLPELHRRLFVAMPDEKTSIADAARKILRPLATRVFRRPVTKDELEGLVTFVELVDEQGDSFEQGIQLALQALLVSPHFLFRIERDPEGQAEVRNLDDFELATRLSYFLWSSMPDDELLNLAAKGQLRKGQNLTRQVERMLADPKSEAYIDSFCSQWLQLRALDGMAFDQELFPGVDQQLLADMREETKLFFANVVRQDLSIIRFLDADFTFANARLAKHYGLEGISGDNFQRVSLTGTPRAGVLTQGSILAVTSNPTRTSPVKRGKFVLDNVLGTPPPPAPGDVPTLEDDGRMLTGSLRQRTEQHRSNPVCASCHKLMDPLGFALENFDAVGRWRTQDEGIAIDASGELPTGEKFDGPAELRQVLLQARRDDFVRCMIEKSLIYALGRGLEYYDICTVTKIQDSLEKDDYRFSTLILGVVRSDPFQKRAHKTE